MYTLRKRVRFYETDGMRVVYHGNYLNWFEEARVEYMREGGVCLNDLLAEGIVFPIVEMNVKYMKSAVYDDIVLVRAYLREVNRVKLVFEYEVLRENTNELFSNGTVCGNVYEDFHGENSEDTGRKIEEADGYGGRGQNGWITDRLGSWIPA